VTPEQFVVSTLRQIQTDFFASASAKVFFQQQVDIKRAIAYPARWLKERGGQWVTVGLMRRILSTIIASIKGHGAPTITRFSVYFTHCVQLHMRHHGDEYLDEAKKMPAIGAHVRGAVREIQKAVGSADPGAVLAEAHRVLSLGRRRSRKIDNVSEGDLFDLCKASAGAAQKQKKFLKPLQHRPIPPISPQTGARADSAL
jgi:hypothetical protein